MMLFIIITSLKAVLFLSLYWKKCSYTNSKTLGWQHAVCWAALRRIALPFAAYRNKWVLDLPAACVSLNLCWPAVWLEPVLRGSLGRCTAVDILGFFSVCLTDTQRKDRKTYFWFFWCELWSISFSEVHSLAFGRIYDSNWIYTEINMYVYYEHVCIIRLSHSQSQTKATYNELNEQ